MGRRLFSEWGFFVFLMSLLADHRIKPDIDIVFVADAVEIIFEVDNFHRRRQGKEADHLEYIGSRYGIMVDVGGQSSMLTPRDWSDLLI